MAKSIDEITELWKVAGPEAKLDYLFIAVCHVNQKIDEGKDTCIYKSKECAAAYVTKKQAKVVTAVLFLLLLSFSVGSGYVTFKEALSMIKP